MRKERIDEINFVRAIAIFAVLLIHVSSSARVTAEWGSKSYPIYLLANQLGQFAVPLFIFISGLVLFYQYFDTWTWKQAIPFYKKRLKYIVVPYLIWSVFYYFFYQVLRQQELAFDLSKFLYNLAWGRSGYHLYFMVIIIQFYLVFPLLITLMRKLKFTAVHLILIGIVVKGIFYYFHHWVEPINHAAALLPNYIIFFCVGGAIGILYKSFKAKSEHLWWTFALAIAIGFFYSILLITSNSGVVFWGPMYVVLYQLYAVLIGISLLWIGQKLSGSITISSRLLYAFGAASFGIYFVHPAVLSLWRTLYKPEITGAMYHLYNIGTMLLVLTIPWGIVYLLRKWKYSWLLFGK